MVGGPSKRYTLAEWRARALELFSQPGDTEQQAFMRARFRCPACGRLNKVEEFEQFKAQGATPDTASQECIGRYTGGRGGPNKCDWAAFGLFRGPHFVVMEDGREVAVFPFDEPETASVPG